MSKVAIIIPARYKSSRFPGKPLALIFGIPLAIRVADIAAKAIGKNNVYIATDDDKISSMCEEYEYSVVMTSDSCMTGTDRVAEASISIDADLFVNIQGDEPMIDPNDVLKAVEAKKENPNYVIACMSSMMEGEDPADLKIPKVVVNENDELMYISRSPIPGSKSGTTLNAKKQICIYVFNQNELDVFASRGKKTELEELEDIEILRFLEMGVPVKMVEVSGNTHAVDYYEDIGIVERLLEDRISKCQT